MFLLDASRKADKAFGVSPSSTCHAVRDSTEDIRIMTKDILERHVVQETNRSGIAFSDPTTKGMEEKVAKGWVEGILQKGYIEDDTM